MRRDRSADSNIEGFAARLTIAGVLNELRADPEAFARLLLALARVTRIEATEVAQLLAGVGAVDEAMLPEGMAR